MSFLKRLKNLWELSEYIPGREPHTHQELTAGTHVEMIVKEPEIKEVFIPRITRDPVKEITNEND